MSHRPFPVISRRSMSTGSPRDFQHARTLARSLARSLACERASERPVNMHTSGHHWKHLTSGKLRVFTALVRDIWSHENFRPSRLTNGGKEDGDAGLYRCRRRWAEILWKPRVCDAICIKSTGRDANATPRCINSSPTAYLFISRYRVHHTESYTELTRDCPLRCFFNLNRTPTEWIIGVSDHWNNFFTFLGYCPRFFVLLPPVASF